MPFSLVTRGRVKLYCVLLDYGIFGEKTDRAVNVESIMQSTNSDTSIGSTATGEIPSCNDGRLPMSLPVFVLIVHSRKDRYQIT